MTMVVTVHFYSYFKELTGCETTTAELPNGSTLRDLHDQLAGRFSKLSQMQKSTLTAVGVEYQPKEYVLKEGDEVSMFPPVQGG
jgi:molybdopterin converting factor small subunit